MWEQTKRKPLELDIPEPPEGMAYLIDLYWECKRTGDPIGWVDMDAWLRLTGRQLEPCEIQALVQLDNIQVRTAREPMTDEETATANRYSLKARLRAALLGRQ